jgi:hypothetical protein
MPATWAYTLEPWFTAQKGLLAFREEPLFSCPELRQRVFPATGTGFSLTRKGYPESFFCGIGSSAVLLYYTCQEQERRRVLKKDQHTACGSADEGFFDTLPGRK